MNPSHPERWSLSSFMARLFRAAAAGVCVALILCAVRMCTVPVLGLGMAAYSLPGGVYGQNLYWACALHFRVCTCGTVFRLGSASSVSCMCMCVCTTVGMCSSSVVPLAVSTCMRALYSIRWHGGLGGVRSIHECYLHVCTVRVPLEQCLAWLARAMSLSCLCLYSYCAYIIAQCTVLVTLVQCSGMASTGNVPTYPCLFSYCACTIAQCVLCLYPLYSV